jgi:NitT/TauT family transport system substrate-binding protein
MKKLRIGHLTTSYHTCFILMGGNWIEDRMGIHPEWRLFPTGPAMVKAFTAGELDIGYIGLPPAMIGISKGLQAKCVAGGHVEGTVLTVRREYRTFAELGSIKNTLSQLRGRAIGTPTRGSIHDVIIRHSAEQAGLQQEVEVKNFPWADFIIEAMEEGTVVGGCGTPPLAVLASKLLNAKIALPPHTMWPNNPSYGILATTQMIENHPDALEEFLKLHEEACNLTRNRSEEAAKMASKATSIIDEDFISEVYRVSPKYCASLPPEYIQSTMAFAPVLRKMGYITAPLSKDDVFYTRLIEATHPEKPHYDDPGALR